PQPPVYMNQMPVQGGQQDVVIMKGPQGPMYVNVRTGEVLGPVQGQQNAFPNNQRFGSLQQSSLEAPPHRSDNRYGSVQELIQPRSTQVQETKPPQVQTPPPPVQPKPSTGLPGVKFKPVKRSKPFEEQELHKEEKSLVGRSLQELITSMISEAHEQADEKLMWYQSGIVIKEYFDTTVKSFEDDLFQGDIEAISRVLKTILQQVESRKDYVFYQAYDKWITSSINDLLSVTMKDSVRIDSFALDFEDLMTHLKSVDEFQSKTVIGYMNDIMAQSKTDILALREKAEGEEPVICDSCAAVPERYSLLYVKLLSEEIGDDGSVDGVKTATKLMESLESLIDEQIFYMVTMDRRVYKVLYMSQSIVNIKCISD
ncbi:MAG: hypothetical protein ACMV1B_02530, partial [Prevotella sp.]